MRTRLVIAFIVVALLSALASSWFHTLIGAYRLPTWLDDVILGPGWLQNLVHTGPGQPAPHPVRHTALVFFGAAAGLLLAMITTVAIAGSRRVLLPVRRLAHAATRMAGGDLSVRIQPRGRDELARWSPRSTGWLLPWKIRWVSWSRWRHAPGSSPAMCPMSCGLR